MPINLKNFINSQILKSKMNDFQDLDHIDGISVSAVCANLYNKPRDDLVMFYFRDGANYASVYTQSKIVSENIKWNLNTRCKKIKCLIVNTRNANAFTGSMGYRGLKEIAGEISTQLSKKQTEDDELEFASFSLQQEFSIVGQIIAKDVKQFGKKKLLTLLVRDDKGGKATINFWQRINYFSGSLLPGLR